MHTRSFLLLLLAGSAAGQDAWSTFRNGPQNRGRTPVELSRAAEQRGREPWSFATKGLIWSTPVVDARGNVYVGSSDKVFYALDPGGKLRWKYTLPDAGDAVIDSAAALTTDGLVVVPGGDGALHALDRETGALRWRFLAHHAGDHEAGLVVNSFEGNVSVGPDGNIYAGSDNAHLYSLDPAGKERWSFGTGMMIWSAPAFSPDGAWLAFGSLDREVYVLEAATGRKLASFGGGGEFKSSPAIDDAGRIYIGCSDGKVRCLERSGDRLRARWTHATGGEVYGSPALAEGRVVIGSHDGFVHCLDAATGELRWKYGTYARISASPLVTADGVVVIGTKAGRLYAIHLATGRRIWSFQVAPGARKVNLDSSPAMGPEGRIHVGSYDGRLYSVPIEWPLRRTDDPRVSFDPNDDRPDFGGPVPEDGATLRIVAADGTLCERAPAPIGPHAPLVLRIVGHRDGRFLPAAAIGAWGLRVETDPPAPVRVQVGSDSYHLTVFPADGWQPGTRYALTVRGRWFQRSGPLLDALKWFIPRFEARLAFETGPARPLPTPAEGTLLRYSVRDMYLAQPEVLDTLVPAAMDGQAFLVSAPLVDRERGRIGLVALPGYPQPDGSVALRAAPEKVFALNGSLSGDAIQVTGAFTLAAMGGEIPLDPVRIGARLSETALEEGWLHGTACLLSVRGNGAAYTGLSWSAMDDMADPRLRLQAIGTMGGKRLTPLGVPVRVASREVQGERVRATLEAKSALEGAHLLVAVSIDDERGTIALACAVEVPPTLAGGKVSLELPVVAGSRVVLLWDGEAIPGAESAQPELGITDRMR